MLRGTHSIAGWCSNFEDEEGVWRSRQMDNRDPWRDLVYAFLELFVACVMLMTTAIWVFTSKLIKFFDLPHPCTFLGHQEHEQQRRNNPGSLALCQQHRRLAQVDDSCIQCNRKESLPDSDEEIGCRSCNVLKKISAGGWKDIQDVNDAGIIDLEPQDKVGDGDFVLPPSTFVKGGLPSTTSTSSSGERCVKRKYAKVFQEQDILHLIRPETNQVEYTENTENGENEEQNNNGVVVLEVDDNRKVDTSEVSVEGVKAALQMERDKLNALYSELEEERNASAVAANQAMAMITRLQEEKAAVQMEARQYQRMVEEKADYDQEAITLLKEILYKREQEKFVLEKEVEIYRQRVLESDNILSMSRKPEQVLLLEGRKEYPAADDDDDALKGRNLLQTFELVQGDDNGSSPNSGTFTEASFDDVETLSLRDNPEGLRSSNNGAGSSNENGDILPSQANSNGDLQFDADDMRTSSMVLRDNFRFAMEEDIKELTSRLQILEDDRQLLKQIVESLRAEKQELREIAHHLRELRLLSSDSKVQTSSTSTFYQAKKRRVEAI